MPYGFGGGLAEGFGTGVQLGQNQQEIKLRREALLKEQINEKIKVTQGFVEAGLKNLSEIVTGAPQRSPQLESTVENYKAQLLEAAQLVAGLGPEGQQAGQMLQQTINNIVPNLKTQSEAFSAEQVGKVTGAMDAVNTITGQPAAAPAAPGVQMAGGPATPTGPAVPSAMDPTQPTQLGSGTAPMNDFMAKTGMDEKQLLSLMLGGKGSDTGDKELPADTPARLGMLQTGIKNLEKADEETGVKGRELLSKPSTWDKSQALGFPGSLVGTHLQRAQADLGTALQGALYALTGATINPVEDERLKTFFFPSIVWDDDKSAAEKINRLYQFLGQTKELYSSRKLQDQPLSVQEALTIAGMDPLDAKDIAAAYDNKGGSTQVAQPEQDSGLGSSAVAGEIPTFASEEEAAAAGLPDGTKVIINGVRGTWRN